MAIKDVEGTEIPAIEVSGRIKIMERIGYKGGTILIRLIDEEVFIWDIFYEGAIHGSHFIIPLPKGQKVHTDAILVELRGMCYAGGATTIDMLRGENDLDEKTKENVELFEANRDKVDQPKGK